MIVTYTTAIIGLIACIFYANIIYIGIKMKQNKQ